VVKRLTVLLIFLALGGLLGILNQQHSGYVMLSWKETSVEMSLWIFLLVLLLVYLVIRLTERLWRLVFGLPNRLKQWSTQRQRINTCKTALSGMEKLLAGEWKNALRQFGRISGDTEEAFRVSLIGSARAAERLGLAQKRDELLAQAEQQGSQGELMAALERVEYSMRRQNRKEAETWLKRVEELSPKHPRLGELQQALNDLGG